VNSIKPFVSCYTMQLLVRTANVGATSRVIGCVYSCAVYSLHSREGMLIFPGHKYTKATCFPFYIEYSQWCFLCVFPRG